MKSIKRTISYILRGAIPVAVIILLALAIAEATTPPDPHVEKPASGLQAGGLTSILSREPADPLQTDAPSPTVSPSPMMLEFSYSG